MPQLHLLRKGLPQINSFTGAIITFILMAWAVLKCFDINFTPALNSFIKSHYLTIGLFISALYILYVFKIKTAKKAQLRIISIAIVLIFLFLMWNKSLFYTRFKQTVLKKYSKNIYLIRTHKTNILTCDDQYSIIKTNFLFCTRAFVN